MKKIGIVLCLLAICTTTLGRSLARQRFSHAKRKFDREVRSYFEKMDKVKNQTQVEYTELGDIIGDLDLLYEPFLVPQKYYDDSDGQVIDFSTLVSYYQLETCPNFDEYNDAVTAMENHLPRNRTNIINYNTYRVVQQKFAQNEDIYERVTRYKEEGNNCMTEIIDRSEALICLEKVKSELDSKIKSFLRLYQRHCETAITLLSSYVTKIALIHENNMKPAYRSYLIALNEVEKCMDFKKIPIYKVGDQVSFQDSNEANGTED